MLELAQTVLLISGAIVFAGAVIEVDEIAHNLMEQMWYRREKKRFQEEVAKGVSPTWCPMLVGYYGDLRIDPNDLVHTYEFKRQLEAVRGLEIRATQ